MHGCHFQSHTGRTVKLMDEMTFTLHHPLTEEELDIIEDVDFDHTNSITFHTKHGKEVVFVKCKRGRTQGMIDAQERKK